jgi:hypothetical protein
MNKFALARAWGNGLSHPIYVPQGFQDVEVLLSEGKVSAASDALWRRATLGSDAAAALLALHESSSRGDGRDRVFRSDSTLP